MAPDKMPSVLAGFTEPPQAMPDDCKMSNTVFAYQKYYRVHKRTFCTWKNRPTPEWYMTQRIVAVFARKGGKTHALRMSVRNFLLTATPEELRREHKLSLERKDVLRAQFIQEMIDENEHQHPDH